RVGTTISALMSQLAAEHRAVNLGQGFPDFDGPSRRVDALARAMRAGHHQSAPMAGLPVLRDAVAATAARRSGYRPDPAAELTVRAGASEAIVDAIAAVVRPGDEVSVLDPGYDGYEPAIDLAGGVAVHVPLDPQTFAPDWELIRRAVSPKTRMLMTNTPHNPSGAMFDAGDIQQLADLLRGTDIVLLSDEVYEHIVYDGRRHESVLRYPELRER